MFMRCFFVVVYRLSLVTVLFFIAWGLWELPREFSEKMEVHAEGVKLSIDDAVTKLEKKVDESVKEANSFKVVVAQGSYEIRRWRTLVEILSSAQKHVFDKATQDELELYFLRK